MLNNYHSLTTVIKRLLMMFVQCYPVESTTVSSTWLGHNIWLTPGHGPGRNVLCGPVGRVALAHESIAKPGHVPPEETQEPRGGCVRMALFSPALLQRDNPLAHQLRYLRSVAFPIASRVSCSPVGRLPQMAIQSSTISDLNTGP